MKKSLASAAIAASLLAGGAGAVIFAPNLASAQSETTTESGGEADRSSWVSDALQTLVDDGTLTQAQADTVQSTLEAARPERREGMAGRGGRGAPFGDLAETLGLDADEIRAELEAGKSLADIATAQGIDPQTLIDEMVADIQAHLDEAVANGRIDETDVADKLAEATQRATDMVNGDLPAFEMGGRGGHGPGGRGPGGHGPLGDADEDADA